MNYFGLFGNPVSHSISPRLHNYALDRLGIDGYYGRICLDNGAKLIEKFNSIGLQGANITVPFKEIALEQCDFLDDIACECGSINTIIKRDSGFKGFNTDAQGFMKSIEEFGKLDTALIIGAGGTAKAISCILTQNKVKVEILNRSDTRRNKFKKYEFFTPEFFIPKKYDLVINTTSAGLLTNTLPTQENILSKIFSESKFAFDVIYGKRTQFLDFAKKYGLVVKDGKEMLLFQAVIAFNIFFDNKFELSKIEMYMRKAMNLK